MTPEPPPTAATGPDREGPGAPWWPVVGLLLLGLFAYANSLGGDFAFDDYDQIRDNPVIQDLGSMLGPAGYRSLPNRYVAYVTFALNHRLGGLHTTGYHVVNLAIHLANALLLYLLVLLAFRSPRLRGSVLAPSARAVGFLAASLFVTHPLGTQAVTYVVQRVTSLATLFYLGTVVAFVAWRLARLEGRWGGARGAGAYGLVLLLSLAAFRTKEISFTLPVTLAIVDGLLLPGAGWRRLLPILPVAALSLLIPLSVLDLGRPPGELLESAREGTRVLSVLSRHDYLVTQGPVIVEYLRLLAFPAGQNLDHDFPVFRSLASPRAAASWIALAALAASGAWMAWRASPRRPRPLDASLLLAAAGIAWFFVTLSVESSLIPIVDVMYEHRAYLPSAGLLVTVAVLGGLLLRRLAGAGASRAIVLSAVAVSLLLASLTLARNVVWATELTLWSDAASKSPGKYRPHLNLGTALMRVGRFGDAVGEFRAAVAIQPDSFPARTNLATALHRAGRIPEAIVAYREALALKPDHVPALYNLAEALWGSGRRDEAIVLYRRFLEVAPATPASARVRESARSRVEGSTGGAR